MKDYMASGSFARGRERMPMRPWSLGNINQSVEVLLKTSHLFEPFPEDMAYDTAFLIGCTAIYRAGKYQKFRPEF